MPQVVRTSLPIVLLALRARLMSALNLMPERVLLVADDDAPPYDPHGDDYLTIRAGKQRWDKPSVGGGRLDNRVRRRCVVTLRTRLLLDPPSEDVLWLTDATLGHHAREHVIFNTLEGKFLEDTGGNLLLYEGMLLEDASAAERPPKRSGWGQSSHAFDLCFTLDLTVTTLGDL